MASYTATGLLVPDSVAVEAQVDAWVDQQLNIVKVWGPLFKQIDDRLSLVFWPQNLPEHYGAKAGCLNVRRKNVGAPDSYMPICTPEGGYREPGSADLERLKSQDLWDPRVLRERERAAEAAERREERQQDNEREDRRQELARNVKALESPSVLINSDLKKGGSRGRGFRS